MGGFSLEWSPTDSWQSAASMSAERIACCGSNQGAFSLQLQLGFSGWIAAVSR